MTPQAFEAFSTGRTLHFTRDGAPFGAEQYFSGRRSLWRFADGTCEAGVWWDEGNAVCFRYGEAAPPQCWHVLDRPGSFAAVSLEAGSETGFVVELSAIDDTPLSCPGPKVGS